LVSAVTVLASANAAKLVDVTTVVNPVLKNDSGIPVAVAEPALVTAPPTPKAAKAVKDPNFPKRPLNAYLIFAREQREKIQKEHPELGFPEVSRLLGQKWESVDKTKYEEENQKLMESYRRDVEEYQKGKTQTSEAEEPTLAVKTPKKKKNKRNVDDVETVTAVEIVGAAEVAKMDKPIEDKQILLAIPTIPPSDADVEPVKPKKKKNKKAKTAEVAA
jgi:hypothetical protein